MANPLINSGDAVLVVYHITSGEYQKYYENMNYNNKNEYG